MYESMSVPVRACACAHACVYDYTNLRRVLKRGGAWGCVLPLGHPQSVPSGRFLISIIHR